MWLYGHNHVTILLLLNFTSDDPIFDASAPCLVVHAPQHRAVHRLLHLPLGMHTQPALVIGRHYVTERVSAPVQYNGIV